MMSSLTTESISLPRRKRSVHGNGGNHFLPNLSDSCHFSLGPPRVITDAVDGSCFRGASSPFRDICGYVNIPHESRVSGGNDSVSCPVMSSNPCFAICSNPFGQMLRRRIASWVLSKIRSPRELALPASLKFESNDKRNLNLPFDSLKIHFETAI
jgi:hypothetical protein